MSLKSSIARTPTGQSSLRTAGGEVARVCREIRHAEGGGAKALPSYCVCAQQSDEWLTLREAQQFASMSSLRLLIELVSVASAR